MPRQVKIGFDKTPAPPIKIYPELVDIQGTPLTDSAGNPLVTEEGASLASFARVDNSTSVFVTNKTKLEVIPIQERFAEESEVSTTLLGVKRAEEQLSLFADVSTYGLDRNNWNYYSLGAGKYPGEWYTRAHPVFGRREPAKFFEGTDEQALYLKSFPTQYAFPDGPNGPEDTQSTNFKRYIRFIALGRWLYEVWKNVNPTFAIQNFLPDYVTIVDKERNPVNVTTNSWLSLPPPAAGFDREIDYWDVQYISDSNADIQLSMDQIEKWTLFYTKMRSGVATYPTYSIAATQSTPQFNYNFLDFSPASGPYSYVQAYTSNDYTRPGGSGNNSTIAVLESRKTFRYQPGRVSGFTFGVRLKNNPASASDKIEWGAANTTDQYMFQVTGSQFNIIRRSTVKLPLDLLEAENGMNLRPGQQYQPDETAVPPSQDGSVPMYTLTIPRSKWNGDPLDGTGESGYIIDFQTVTMYKIEYSWYGAVGAKFYAYVPIGGGDARWVRLHTLVIENGLTQPILQNPDFKFRYVLSNENTEDLSQPTYIYKYGSSYYIDGGDEGTITLNSITSDTREFTVGGSILGMHPKTKILNSTGRDSFNQLYDGAANLKKIYPATLAVYTDSMTRIDIEQVKVSPDGHHGSLSVDLSADSAFEKDISFNFISPERINLIQGQLDLLDDKSKIIADGIYNTYVGLRTSGGIVDDAQGDIYRRSAYNLNLSSINEQVKLSNGTYVETSGYTVTNARLVGYKSVVGSDTPIYANRFKIHFLNPTAFDGPNHYADFAIGITPNQPVVEVVSDDEKFLRFGEDLRVYTTTLPPAGNTYFDVTDTLHVEWSNREHVRDLGRNADVRESDTSNGTRLEIDYRLRGVELPQGGTRGVIGCVQGEVVVNDYPVQEVIAAPTIDTNLVNSGDLIEPGNVTHKIVFVGLGPPVTKKTLGEAEAGVNRASSNYVYLSTVVSEQINGVNRQVAYVKRADGAPVLGEGEIPIIEQVGAAETYKSVQARAIRLFDDNKLNDADPEKNFSTPFEVFRFDVFPLYLFVAMRSNARINNIIVEEFSTTSKSTFTPNFVGTKQGVLGEFSNINIATNGAVGADPLTAQGTSPTNFQSYDRLSGVNYDTSTQNPIADGEKIYSFYVGSNESVSFDLSNLFNLDRAYLSTGLYNNNALYFKAVSLIENQGANVQMTITSKEQ